MKLPNRIAAILYRTARLPHSIRLLLAACMTCAIGAFGLHFWAGMQAASAPTSLAAILPRGAMITFEAQDFRALLEQWNTSPEEAAWIKSSNYEAFSRSHLFGRLQDAQKEFAQVVGLSPDGSFLNEIAGQQSVFAWYDIGNLEFVYITRMPGGTADKTRLLQSRGTFASRQIGDQTFYVRTQMEPHRTVAFATSGDLLLLATREDLMAGALALIAHPKDAAIQANALTADSAFAEAQAAAAKQPGQLRMTLNLTKVVPSPQFRSYWIQQNITEMKQFRASVTDLYLESGQLREERVLLPAASANGPAEARPASAPANGELAALVALLPPDTGVFRATADPDPQIVSDSILTGLIKHSFTGQADLRFAPTADFSVPQAGAASDLESRIDTPPFVEPAKSLVTDSLTAAITSAAPDALLTTTRTREPIDGIWVPFQSAVLLHAPKDWDLAAIQTALQQSAQARLTAGGLGLNWKQIKLKGASYWELNETKPLELAVKGKLCILADDPQLMNELLAHGFSTPEKPSRGKKNAAPTSQSTGNPGSTYPADAALIAGVNLTPERASFARWSTLVDRNSSGSGSAGSQNGNQPAFFSANMRSLADAFAPLDRERMVERHDGPLTRQTVTYLWKQ